MGISQRLIAAMIGLTQARISQIFAEVLRTLMEQFVPIYMGSNAFTRQNIISNHTPSFLKEMLLNVLCIMDGTYIYCQI